MKRRWQDELYDHLASACETGSPGLAMDRLAATWKSSKQLWGGTGHFHEIHKELRKVARRLKKDYNLEFDL